MFIMYLFLMITHFYLRMKIVWLFDVFYLCVLFIATVAILFTSWSSKLKQTLYPIPCAPCIYGIIPIGYSMWRTGIKKPVVQVPTFWYVDHRFTRVVINNTTIEATRRATKRMKLYSMLRKRKQMLYVLLFTSRLKAKDK